MDTFSSVLQTVAELGVAATGVTVLMAVGEFDLSIGATFIIVPLFYALLQKIGIPFGLSFFMAVGLSLIIGLANGLMTILLNIPSFIVTLGMLFVGQGVVLLITEGMPVSAKLSDPLLHLLSSVVVAQQAQSNALRFVLNSLY